MSIKFLFRNLFLKIVGTDPTASGDIVKAYDPNFNKLYENVHTRCAGDVPISQKKKRRKYIVYQMFESIVRNHRKINSIEFGVYRGQTSLMLTDVANSQGVEIRHYIADSFQGLSEPTDVDGAINSDMQYSMSPQKESIEKLLPDACLIEGWIPESLPSDLDVRFQFSHIDVDLYEPVKGALDWLVGHTEVGSVIIVDDYSVRWPGCVRAVGEFLDVNKDFHGFDTTLGNFVITRHS